MPRILLVEDDDNTRLGLCELLRQEGYEVEAAATASQALEKLSESVDILLTDLRLPDISGHELHLWAAEARPPLVTILMSAYRVPEVYEAAMRSGVFRWIAKPLQIETLLDTLEAAVEASVQKKKRVYV